MAALSLWINGVDVSAHWYRPNQEIGDASFERRVGGRAPGRFTVYGVSGVSGFRPVDGQSIELHQGANILYAGKIVDLEEGPLTDLDTGAVTVITAADLQLYPELAIYTVTYSAGAFTLKQILQDLVDGPLTHYGITLDPAQAAGTFVFTDLAFTNATVASILNYLQTLTAWPWRITPDGILSMVAPATVACGFSLGDAAGSVQDVVRKKKTRSTQYANTIVLTCGPSSGAFLYVGDRTADGVATSWQFDLPGSTSPWAITVAGVPKTVTPVGGGGQYEWDPVTYTLHTGTDGTPGAGAVIEVSYWVNYPFRVTVADAALVAAEGTWAAGYSNDSITDYPGGFDYATALLRTATANPWTVTVRHRSGLAWPGQTVPLSFVDRAVAATHMILNVRAQTDVDDELVVDMDCLEGSELQPQWLDYFRSLTGGGSSGGGSASGSVTTITASVLSSPVYLGGTGAAAVAADPAAWANVVNFVPYNAQGSFPGRVRCAIWARAGGVSVTARLWDATAGVAVMTSSAITSQTPVEVVMTGDITAGHAYVMQILNSGNAQGVYCGYAQLESTS
jgi:hypothetical protein